MARKPEYKTNPELYRGPIKYEVKEYPSLAFLKQWVLDYFVHNISDAEIFGKAAHKDLRIITARESTNCFACRIGCRSPITKCPFEMPVYVEKEIYESSHMIQVYYTIKIPHSDEAPGRSQISIQRSKSKLHETTKPYTDPIKRRTSEKISEPLRTDVKYKRLSKDTFPITQEGSCFCIRAPTDIIVNTMDCTPIRTGISIEIPVNSYAQLHVPFDLAKRGLARVGGVIDSDYRGEIKVIYQHIGTSNEKIARGQPLVYFTIDTILTPKVQEVSNLSETIRGGKGFGSSDRE
ncbi:Deoxyuridine triphosphate nucleotidohydrolase like protein [Aduncisulcus paluster]|uniref:dUTP diphosphatase n=1 Tax=Aduncisulcus paluster TaxID=2918883 RepID=A0ABQ5K2S4_9EUKA|nr:Deoxyuridine triphosphate nucleotidohydrolase like protein [Aduncisulcus paluster]